MDNQQRSLDSQLAWLGGIIDGEGMVTAVRRTGKTDAFIPRISIVNTDTVLTDECEEILSALHLPYYLQTKAAKGTWKEKREILIGGFMRCRRVLPVIIPVLVAKKGKAEGLLRLCDMRLMVGPRSPWTQEQVELALSLRCRI